jgi:hypothetical protein
MSNYETNPVGALQERCQGPAGGPPEYLVARPGGTVFSARVSLGSHGLAATGCGATKREARHAAARALLDRLDGRAAGPKAFRAPRQAGDMATNSNRKFKTELCRNQQAGWCKYGEICQFAHSPAELQRLPAARQPGGPVVVHGSTRFWTAMTNRGLLGPHPAGVKHTQVKPQVKGHGGPHGGLHGGPHSGLHGGLHGGPHGGPHGHGGHYGHGGPHGGGPGL